MEVLLQVQAQGLAMDLALAVDPAQEAYHLTQTTIAILQALIMDRQVSIHPLYMESLLAIQIQITTITLHPHRVVQRIRTAPPLRAALAPLQQLQV